MTSEQSTPTGTLLVNRRGAVAYLVVSNPQKRNAMTQRMWEQIPDILATMATDAAVRVVVLTGAGDKAFVSGADISEFGSKRHSAQAVSAYEAKVTLGLNAIREFVRPVIAIINGHCIGGGMALALACDMRLAASSARFGIPAAKLGLGYERPNIKTLTDVVGAAAATEILFTARTYDADQARRMGLLNEVCSAQDLPAATEKLCAKISALAPLSIEAAKRSIRAALEPSDPDRQTAADAAVMRCAVSQDYAEGMTAFMEKRPAVFTGK